MSRRSRRRPALPLLEQLDARVTPALIAQYADGTLTVTGDAENDTGVLTADPGGNILLNGGPIAGGPTLGNTLAVIMRGGGGNDLLDVSNLPGANRTVVLEGQDGDDTLAGGAAATSIVGGIGNDSLVGNAGDDNLDGGAGNDTLRGGQGDDRLIGGDGDDLLDGGTRDDILRGDAGADTFIGGAGDDFLDGTTNADGAPDTAAETIDGDAVVTDATVTGLGTDTMSGIEQVAITGGPGNNRIDASSRTAGGVSLLGGGGNDTLIGTAFNDTLDGQGGNDSLVGNAGDDVLFGGEGNDTLRGGLGNDSLTGALGNDVLAGEAGTDWLVEDPSTTATLGTNLFLTNTALQGALGADVLSSLERAVLTAAVGSANNSFNATNFSGPVTLNGGAGNDTLTGGASSDVLTGGPGTNFLNGGPGGIDTVVETADLNFTLTNTRLNAPGPGGLAEALTSIERAVLTGGPGHNTLTAAAFTLGPVTLNGGLGDDTLTGTAFSDVLTGGLGSDSIAGGGGFDRLVETLDAPTAVLTNTRLDAGALGVDTLASIERVDLTGGALGNVFDASAYSAGLVTLTGAAGNDILIGGTGNDLLTGGAGDDTLAGGGGIDTVSETADTDFTLMNTALVSAATGTDLLSGNERVSLTGGAGDNSFTVSGVTDFPVTLNGGAGNDRVVSVDNADFTLRNGLLTRSNGGSFTLVSVERAALTGGAGDTFFTVTGWTGQATLTGGGGADRVVATANANMTLTDTLLAVSGGGTFTLSGVTQARLTGGFGANRLDASAFTGRTTLVGGDGPDTLIGGTGNDFLFGGNGADFLDGRDGFDTLDGGAGTDVGVNGEAVINIP